MKKRHTTNVHIPGLVRWDTNYGFRTGTLSEIRPDNMYQPLQYIRTQPSSLKNHL